MVVTVAKNKNEFISAWDEHIDDLARLCNNFEGEAYDKAYQQILRIRIELKVVVRNASENLD